jgi:hypothetical protein
MFDPQPPLHIYTTRRFAPLSNVHSAPSPTFFMISFGSIVHNRHFCDRDQIPLGPGSAKPKRRSIQDGRRKVVTPWKRCWTIS